MTALVLAGVLALVPAADERDALIKALDDDFQELLKKEKDPQPLRDAARLLAANNASDRWLNYSNATELLRKHRSRAAVPLLLRYMVEHAGLSTGPGVVAEYVDTLAILTGKDLANPYRYVPDRKAPVNEAVAKLVKEWWGPGKDKINTDLGKMSPEQLRVVADRVARRAARRLDASGDDDSSALAISSLVSTVVFRGRDRSRDWSREDLHPAMVPIFLGAIGYVDPKEAKAPPAAETHRVPFAVVPLLAALRADGAAPQLDKLAEDKNQNTAVRLTCLLALRAAGERVKAAPFLAVLDGEKQLERRLVATLALAYTSDRDTATPKLVGLLDDANDEVRTAAVLALRRAAAKEAIPGLKKIIDGLEPAPVVSQALDGIAEIGTTEAKQVLAGFLKGSLEGGRKKRYLRDALWAFERATGQRWVAGGAHDEAYYQEKAKVALEWWEKHK
ncbi:MAG TPA: HEAT repeat domain-containing protein [Gemmataceae bacterium]|nr:HEAT repeat domain-containing protein [Gemmataceae bacterium]